MKKTLVCFIMLLTSCVVDSIPEQSGFIDDEDYKPNQDLERDKSHQDTNSCYYVGGVTALYIDDKEVLIYYPVVCLEPSEEFPEIIIDVPENNFDINNRFDNNIFRDKFIR